MEDPSTLKSLESYRGYPDEEAIPSQYGEHQHYAEDLNRSRFATVGQSLPQPRLSTGQHGGHDSWVGTERGMGYPTQRHAADGYMNEDYQSQVSTLYLSNQGLYISIIMKIVMLDLRKKSTDKRKGKYKT